MVSLMINILTLYIFLSRSLSTRTIFVCSLEFKVKYVSDCYSLDECMGNIHIIVEDMYKLLKTIVLL